MPKPNNTLTWRVGRLERSVDKVDENVDTILQNHLPHLDNKITRLTWLAGLNLIGILLALIFAKFL